MAETESWQSDTAGTRRITLENDAPEVHRQWEDLQVLVSYNILTLALNPSGLLSSPAMICQRRAVSGAAPGSQVVRCNCDRDPLPKGIQ